LLSFLIGAIAVNSIHGMEVVLTLIIN